MPQQFFIAFGFGNRFVHHVVVRHGNVTSIPDVVLLFVVRILSDSMSMFSCSCVEHEDFNLFVSILDNSLAQGRTKLEPSGLAGVVTLHGIAEALLIFNFPSGIVRKRVNASQFSRSVASNLGFRFSPLSVWHYAVSLLACLTTLPDACFLVLL